MTSLHREPVEIDPKRCFDPRQRVKIFQRAKGRCELCNAKIRGTWIAGHIKAHSLGGKTVVENGRVECLKCGKVTHTDDTETAARCKRMAGETGQYARRKRRGPTLKSGKKLQGRGFPSKEERARAKAWKKERER